MGFQVAFVGSERRNHLDALRDLVSASDEAFFAVAYVRRAGVDLIKSEIEEAMSRGAKLRILSTVDFGLTEPAAVEALEELGADVRLVQYPDRAYHPKVYMGTAGIRRRAIVGSANLTAAALVNNVEAGVELATSGSERAWNELEAHLSALWDDVGDTRPPVQWSAKRTRGASRLVPGFPPSIPPAWLGGASLVRDGHARPASAEFEAVWKRVAHLVESVDQIKTATGKPNALLGFDEERGVLVGTARSAEGQWVDRSMFERTVEATLAWGRLRLNAREDTAVRDCTRYLRVHRSSAVFAILAAIDGFELEREDRSVVLVRR